MEASLRSRKRKYQSSISDDIFTRSKSQIFVHRHRSGYARADSIRTSNLVLSLEGTTKSQAKKEQWGYMVDHVASEVSVKDLRARRVFSPTTITDDEVSSVGKVDLKADVDAHKMYDGNPNVSSPEGDAGGDLGVCSSVAIDPKPSSENNVDSFLVSENNAMGAEADPQGGAGHGDLGVSCSVTFDLKSRTENNMAFFLASDNYAMEADEFVKLTPRVSESNQSKGFGEQNGIISVANEITDTQGSMSSSQSSMTSSRSKKKVFISPKSFSYRRLLPYLTELEADDSSNFEIVKATSPKVQKSSNMVSNMAAYRDHEIDAVPNNNKSGLSDTIQKSHQDALNNTLEDSPQMTPPDSDIYSIPIIDKSPEVLVKTTDAATARNFSNENKDSISSSNLAMFDLHFYCSNMVLKSCSRIKMLKTPTSFSYRRLLPFLMSVSGDESCALKVNQLSKPENTSEQNQELHSSVIMNESKSIADEKSDSPTSTLSPIKAPFDTVVPNDSISDSNGLEMNSQVEDDNLMKLEQESPIKDLNCVEETTSDLEIVPNADSNHNQKPVDESRNESLMPIAPLNSPPTNRDNLKNGILKRTPRGCRGICNCLNCTSFRLHADRSFEFSRNQMHDAEEVALDLINDLACLRNILERTMDSNDAVKAKEVKEACAKTLYKEEVARARLAQMNEDLSFHSRSMTLLRPKVTFANKIEEKVISDKKLGER